MAGQPHADFLTHRADRVQEILEVLPQIVRPDILILLQGLLQQGQPLRLPPGQRESLAAFRRPADNFQRAHLAQILLVEIQAVAPVLRNHPGQVRPQPVEHRHKVIDNHLHAVAGQHPDRRDIIRDIFLPARKAQLDILMNVDALYDLDLEACVVHFVHFLFQRPELLLRPVHAGGLVQQAHQPGHAGNLLHILQRDRIRLASVPAKCHFHRIHSPLLSLIIRTDHIDQSVHYTLRAPA